MRVTYTKLTALAITRALRNQSKADAFARRCDLKEPDPTPNRRWSRERLDPRAHLPGLNLPTGLPLGVAASGGAARVNMKGVTCGTYGKGLPVESFLDLGDGVAISSPELLFVEMGTVLALPQHIMLGHELCGSISRDAADPRNGKVRMNVDAVTSVERIGRFLDAARGIRGLKRARRALELTRDNAWSPTESVVATMACLPLDEFGYGLGKLTLNKRISTPEGLLATTDKESRVPDILFDQTPVGINYDGAVHLDLDSIVDATRRLAEDPGSSAFDRELREALNAVRAKVVDDIMRNRELAADGLVVFPVVKEDLNREDGLDRVMLQVVQSIEERTGRDLTRQRRAIALPLAKQRRRELLNSLLPKRQQVAARMLAPVAEEVSWEFISGI